MGSERSHRRSGKIARKIRAGASAGAKDPGADAPEILGESSGAEASTPEGGSGATEATVVGTDHMTDPTEQPLSGEAADLLLEANAAIAGAEPEALTPDGLPPPPPVDASKEFRDVLHLPVMFVSAAVLPQWNISDEYRQEWTAATAECLAQLFPDGINGKYACWFRLLACSGVIVVNGIAQNGGKLPGVGPKKAPNPSGAEHGSATPAS